MKSGIKALANALSIPLRWRASASAADAGIHKKNKSRERCTYWMLGTSVAVLSGNLLIGKGVIRADWCLF